MEHVAAIIERLTHAYGRGVEREVAERLLSFLSSHAETTHVSLQLLRQMTPGAGSGNLDAEIVRSLSFLAGDSVQVLDACFEFIDESDQPHALTTEEAKDAVTMRLNPLTGEPDPTVPERVVIYFSPTDEAKAMLRGNATSGG